MNYLYKTRHPELAEGLKVKDYSVSNENFELHYNQELDLLKTFPEPHNLDKYYQSEDYISHTDSKRSFFEKLYHWVKTYTLNQKEKLLSSHLNQKGTLLDIGAGTGDFLAYVQGKGWKTTGIEPNEKAKELARKKGISFVENAESLEEDSFDVITMWHVLEHV